MKLNKILSGLDIVSISGDSGRDISGLTFD